MVRTVLGYGAPDKQGSFAAHGSPLGAEETRRTKRNLGWPEDAAFLVPDAARAHLRQAIERGARLGEQARARLQAYTERHPQLAAELLRRLQGRLPEGFARALPAFAADAKGLPTRKASAEVLASLAAALPELVGGSADLDPSTYTKLEGQGDFEAPWRARDAVQGAAGGVWGHAGRNLHFGVREHAMGCIVNGLSYHGGFVPFGATFLAFADYMRPPIRLAALARLGSIFVFTHDSIGLGEDGPTHQPIGQLASLRAIPELLVIRPCDANETAVAWQLAIEQRARPTVLVLSRQSLPTLDRARLASAEGLRRGAYVLEPDEGADPDLILMGSGSELSLVLSAARTLRAEGRRVRTVSMPCFRLFDQQPADYRERVLPARVTARLAVEAASPLGWDRYTGLGGAVIGLDRFGASAPGEVVMRELGFTVEHVAQRARELFST
jgi:transketolase